MPGGPGGGRGGHGGHGGPRGGMGMGMGMGMGHRPPRRGCMGCGCLPMVLASVTLISMLIYFIF